ncbi:MAG: WG repeat-containing protein, partial [Clostridia bacterium]|nr:WG repeat-containing protein [Clostridia bacterium]
PGYYYDYDEAKPGKWGFVNLDGKVVVEPKYVYAIGFWNGGGEHSVVARFVDGKLRWGVIDLTGKEVIPCIYPEAYCRWGEAVAFKEEGKCLYGLLDFDGNVIVEPKFDYIEAYDPKHRMVTAGESEHDLGVYSVELGKMIIPAEFDCVDYGERMISCEIKHTCKDKYYDYEGNELPFNDYESVFEYNDVLKAWKDGKVGVIDWDGSIIVPFILEDGTDIHTDYYRKGYYITGSHMLVGLSKTDGTVILPEIYSNISFHGGLVIASSWTDTKHSIKDALFTIDGVLLMEGRYRRMRIGDDGILEAETPQGKYYYLITQS